MPFIGRMIDGIFVLSEIFKVILIGRYLNLSTLVDIVVISVIVNITPIGSAMYAVASHDDVCPIACWNFHLKYIVTIVYASHFHTPRISGSFTIEKIGKLAGIDVIPIPTPIGGILTNVDNFGAIKYACSQAQCDAH